MLIAVERHQILLFLRCFCKARFLPADVDVQRWELRQFFHTGDRRGWICKAFYALFALRALYKNLSLIHVLLSPAPTPLHQIMVHAVLAAAYWTFVYWYYVLYIQQPDVYAALLHMTLTAKIGQSKATRFAWEIVSFRWLWKISFIPNVHSKLEEEAIGSFCAKTISRSVEWIAGAFIDRPDCHFPSRFCVGDRGVFHLRPNNETAPVLGCIGKIQELADFQHLLGGETKHGVHVRWNSSPALATPGHRVWHAERHGLRNTGYHKLFAVITRPNRNSTLLELSFP